MYFLRTDNISNFAGNMPEKMITKTFYEANTWSPTRRNQNKAIDWNGCRALTLCAAWNYIG